ncbi:hypothetical protein BJV78DRAFT_1259463 [Lactifluus subvellereus]|nr:hypothetical protein BJV78DRAFT_1259463 [Lactifluus subvellereus]
MSKKQQRPSHSRKSPMEEGKHNITAFFKTYVRTANQFLHWQSVAEFQASAPSLRALPFPPT